MAATFDGDARRRISRAVKRVEQWPADGPLPPDTPGFSKPGDQNIQRLRITSASPGAIETVAGVDYYPATVRTWDSAGGVWTDLTAEPAVVVFDPDGGTFAEDDEVEARQITSIVFDGEPWPVFEKITGGGGGAVKVFRVQTFFCQDTNPPVTSPSPNCYYPVIERLQTAAGGWVDGTFVAWWVTPFAYAVWPPVTAPDPYTVVRSDGSGYVNGISAGYDYAPDDGEHEFAGESRPVYKFADYDAAWGLTCTTDDDGHASIGPVLG